MFPKCRRRHINKLIRDEVRVLILFIFSCNVAFGSLYDAQRLYDKKLYKQAIEMAKSSTKDYPNPKLHIIWAKSAEKLGRDKEAMSAYERALMLNSQTIEIKKSLLSIYIKTKRYKLAKKFSKDEKINLSEYKLDNYQDITSTLSSSIYLYYGYDTNYNIQHKRDTVNEFYDNVDGPTKLASNFSQAIIDVVYTNEFDNNTYIHTKFNGYYKSVINDKNYNLYLNTVEIGVGYYSSKYNFYIPISYSILNYLRKDYLWTLSIVPQFDYKISDNLILNINTTLQKRKIKINSNRDDRSLGLGGVLYYIYKDNYLFLNVNYKEFKSLGALYQDFTDKKSFSMVVGTKHTFNTKTNLIASYRVSLSNYNDNIGTINAPNSEIRSDTYSQINIKLSREITKNIVLYIENEYSTNKSNFVPSDYDKNVISVGISINY